MGRLTFRSVPCGVADLTATPIAFRPMKLETVVVMRGDKVVGTIRRYRAHRACVVSVPGLLTASMAIGQGKATFPNIPAAKARLLELDREQRQQKGS